MQDSYMTESFVQYQTTFLIASLCKDDMVCEDAVQTYWPGSGISYIFFVYVAIIS